MFNDNTLVYMETLADCKLAAKSFSALQGQEGGWWQQSRVNCTWTILTVVRGWHCKKARPLSLPTKPKQKMLFKNNSSSGLRFSIPAVCPLLPLSIPTVFPNYFSSVHFFFCLINLNEIKMFQAINCKAINGFPLCEMNSTKTLNV